MFFQPSVASTYTKVTDCPFVVKSVLAAIPPIFSDPFGLIVN